ncbi:hypothetical protein J6590_028044, partial [Homalodisca vitripennis]
MAYQELVESHVVGPVSGHRSSSAGFIPSPPPPPPDAPAEDKCHHHTERILEMTDWTTKNHLPQLDQIIYWQGLRDEAGCRFPCVNPSDPQFVGIGL